MKGKGDLSCSTAPQSGKNKGFWYLHHAVHPRAVNHVRFERRGVCELSTQFLGGEISAHQEKRAKQMSQ